MTTIERMRLFFCCGDHMSYCAPGSAMHLTLDGARMASRCRHGWFYMPDWFRDAAYQLLDARRTTPAEVGQILGHGEDSPEVRANLAAAALRQGFVRCSADDCHLCDIAESQGR